MSDSLLYFKSGKLIAEHGTAKVYLYDNKLHLEIGPGHNLWVIEDEIKELSQQIDDLPRGDCLEIGLGLGIASKYILSKPDVKTLTTVEINPDVIAVQKIVNKIDDPRHRIINMNGLDFMLSTSNKYDFIFFDNYSIIDEDTLNMLNIYVKVAKRILNKDGTLLGWLDPYTPEEDIERFINIFERE